MTQYYSPSSWFWILMAFLVCCALSFSNKRTQPMKRAIEHASAQILKVME